MQLRTLSALECTRFLEEHRLGYLACSFEDRPYAVPVYYAFANNSLYSFSMPGKKIEIMKKNPRVSLLVEEFGKDGGWKSVIAEGRFEVLADRVGSKVELDRAWSLLSRHVNWWEPGGLKPDAQPLAYRSDHLFYRILIDELSGRENVVSGQESPH